MAQDEIESLRIGIAEFRRSLRSSRSRRRRSLSFESISSGISEHDERENELLWAALERLPTVKRITTALFDETAESDNGDGKGKRIVDVSELLPQERHMLIEKLIKHIQNDNLRLLQKMRKRIDK